MEFGPNASSAIFIEVKCHSLLHISGNTLRLAEVLIFTFLMVKYNFFNLAIGKIFFFYIFTKNGQISLKYFSASLRFSAQSTIRPISFSAQLDSAQKISAKNDITYLEKG